MKNIFRSAGIRAFALMSLPVLCLADPGPSWWTNVLDDASEPADYSPALLGQLKWFATNAYDDLEANLAGGAGTNIEDMVLGFTATNAYQVLNVGQLKQVGARFYDRLIETGNATNYPWTTGNATDDVDRAMCTIGQLKYVFAFDTEGDGDADGMLDWWERQQFGSTGYSDGSTDTDGDGLSDGLEHQYGADPHSQDSDGDGLDDGDEIDNDADPILADTDGDGLTDGEEVNTYGTEPDAIDSDSDGMPDGWEVAYALNPLEDDASGNPDGDLVDNLTEYLQGRDPRAGATDDTTGIVSLEVLTLLE